MEYPIDTEINNIIYNNDLKKISIYYENNSNEDIILNIENYIKIFDKWFINVPMFLSDKFKTIIKSLNFIKINKDINKNLIILDEFFSNTDNCKKFFDYTKIRNQKIIDDKKKWSVAPDISSTTN